MKIIIYSENNYGCGASIAAFRLAAGLAKKNEVLYTYKSHKKMPVAFIDNNIVPWHIGKSTFIRELVYKVVRMMSRFMKMNLDVELYFYIFMRKIKQEQPDVVHLHNCYFTHKQIARLSTLVPVVWTMHDQFAVYKYNYKINTYEGDEKIYCPINEWRIKEYNVEDLLNCKTSNILFTPPSDWLKNLSEKILSGRKNIITVNNGIPTSLFLPVDKVIARNKIGIDKDKFTILFLAGTGAWERKNATVIIEALKLIPALDIQVIAIGSISKTGSSDKRLIKKGSVNGIDSLSVYYSSADVFCISSIVDNLPNTVLESFSCGTPVLGSKVGGIPEMVVEGKTGWLFDPYNARELANKIVDLQENHDQVKNIAKNCREFAVNQFDESVMVNKYEAIYLNKGKFSNE